MRALFNTRFTKADEPDSAEPTEPEPVEDASDPVPEATVYTNMKRNVSSAWHSFAYGKWRRQQDNVDDFRTHVWLLGRCYVPTKVGANYTECCPNFFADYSSRIFLSYRRDFPPISPSLQTSDCGWGCMLRSAQMLVAQALTCIHIGRHFRIERTEPSAIQAILKLFEDTPTADLSIHKLMGLGGADVIGQWFSPSRALGLMRDAINASNHPLLDGIKLHLCVDNILATEEVEEISDGWKKAVVIVVCVRLGTKKINQCYQHQLKIVLSLENCVGIVGGKPKHAVYFIGYHGDSFFNLDPHVAQKYTPLDNTPDPKVWSTFHCRKPSRMKVDAMDPSCAIGFLVRDRNDFCILMKNLAESGTIECQSTLIPPVKESVHSDGTLFCVVDQRPSSDYSFTMLEDSPERRQVLTEDEDNDLDGFEVV
uniref:Cysteine protease n=1 Tax=Panagrellus redivivus TaxID=6233 RepID=A0A7E5A1A4_PANRE